MSEDKKEMKISYAPNFTRDMNRIMRDMSPEEQEDFLAAFNDAVEQLKENPYMGTPLTNNPFVLALNWCRRVLWQWGVRW